MSSICVSLINVESTWSFKTEGDLKKNGWINYCVIIVGQRILSTLTYLLFIYFQWKKKIAFKISSFDDVSHHAEKLLRSDLW